MKSISLTLLLLPCLIQLSCFQTSHCSRFTLPNDLNLIQQTCKKTPDYNLCVSSLESDPRSEKADVAGLGVVLVDIVKAKSTQTLDKVNSLLKQSLGDQALKDCASFYNAVINGDVPEASQGFSLGNPKFAEQGMNDAAGEAHTCEDGFKGRESPLTPENKLVQGLAAVAAAIARTLL